MRDNVLPLHVIVEKHLMHGNLMLAANARFTPRERRLMIFIVALIVAGALYVAFSPFHPFAGFGAVVLGVVILIGAAIYQLATQGITAKN